MRARARLAGLGGAGARAGRGAARAIEVVVASIRIRRLPGEAPPAPDADRRRRREALALLMYTSGTTGKPKGVMLTQANLAANAQAISRGARTGRGDRVLAVLPLYHINAFAVTMLAPLAHGGSLAMPPRFSAARVLAAGGRHRCTWINVVPTIISYLLEGEAPPREPLRAIRFCRSASAALPPEHHRAFEQKFGIGIVETMGLTETVAPSFSNPMRARTRAASARSAARRAARRGSSIRRREPCPTARPARSCCADRR